MTWGLVLALGLAMAAPAAAGAPPTPDVAADARSVLVGSELAPKGSVPDARASAAVDRILDAADVMKAMDTMIPLLVESVLPLVVQGNDARAGELRIIVGEEMTASIAKLKPAYREQLARLYAGYFTTDELEALARFMESPLGRKNAAATNDMAQAMFSFGREAGQQAGMDALPRIVDRMRALDFKLPSGI